MIGLVCANHTRQINISMPTHKRIGTGRSCFYKSHQTDKYIIVYHKEAHNSYRCTKKNIDIPQLQLSVCYQHNSHTCALHIHTASAFPYHTIYLSILVHPHKRIQRLHNSVNTPQLKLSECYHRRTQLLYIKKPSPAKKKKLIFTKNCRQHKTTKPKYNS